MWDFFILQGTQEDLEEPFIQLFFLGKLFWKRMNDGGGDWREEDRKKIFKWVTIN
jgi:hypothetical protein